MRLSSVSTLRDGPLGLLRVSETVEIKDLILRSAPQGRVSKGAERHSLTFFRSAPIARIICSSRRSMDPPFLALPIALAQLALQDFAGGRARQCGDEVDRFRQLVTGDALARVGDDLGFARMAVGFEHND